MPYDGGDMAADLVRVCLAGFRTRLAAHTV